MGGFTEALIACIEETDLLTWAGTVAAVLYVILALKESVWCWAFGIISSALWVSIYFHEQLWYESILNIFYVVLGVYGWISWAKEKHGDRSKPELSISKIPAQQLLVAVVVAVASGIILGFISGALTENRFAYSDALLSSFSVVATWMTAKKYLENWLFWIVIDACSAGLYFIKGPSMYLAALLFIFYTFMAVGGYFAWKKNWKA